MTIELKNPNVFAPRSDTWQPSWFWKYCGVHAYSNAWWIWWHLQRTCVTRSRVSIRYSANSHEDSDHEWWVILTKCMDASNFSRRYVSRKFVRWLAAKSQRLICRPDSIWSKKLPRNNHTTFGNIVSADLVGTFFSSCPSPSWSRFLSPLSYFVLLSSACRRIRPR